MFIQTHTKAALLAALTLVLVGCGKQEGQPAASPAAAASTSAFPTGNGDKTMTLADCDKLPDPKRADDSATGRSTAVSLGMAARAACKKKVTAQQDKPAADLARIREIKEKEQADQANREISDQEFFRGLNESANTPLKEYKY